MCDHVCVCVIFGRIGLCGTVLLRHDVEVRDRQSLFPFSLSFFSLSLSLSLSLFFFIFSLSLIVCCMCDLWTHRLVWHGTVTLRRCSPRQTVFVPFLSFLLFSISLSPLLLPMVACSSLFSVCALCVSACALYVSTCSLCLHVLSMSACALCV